MASIRKLKSGKYQVRWLEHGQARSRVAPTAASAKELAREVDVAIALKGGWEPAQVGAGADLRLIEVHRAYLKHAAATQAATTVYRTGVILDVWELWLGSKFDLEQLTPRILSRRLMVEHHAHLLRTGLHGRPRSPATAQRHLIILYAMWRWAFEEEEWEGQVPYPRRVQLQTPAGRVAVAPTWAEMDAAIAEASGPQAELAIVLRFTGLRVQQAMGLTWEDVDLDRGRLRIRGELGKSRQERAGREIPISVHLVAILRAWKRQKNRPTDWLLRCNRKEGVRERSARTRDMGAAWARAEVRPAAWKHQPHHAFRKGFVTELARAGADREAVEVLVGHSRGIRGHYVDPAGLPLLEAVALIPPLSEGT